MDARIAEKFVTPISGWIGLVISLGLCLLAPILLIGMVPVTEALQVSGVLSQVTALRGLCVVVAIVSGLTGMSGNQSSIPLVGSPFGFRQYG